MEPGQWVGGPGLTNPAAGPGEQWIEGGLHGCGTEYAVHDSGLTPDELATRAELRQRIEAERRTQAAEAAEFERAESAWEESVRELLAGRSSQAERTVLVVAEFTEIRQLNRSPWREFDVDWQCIQRLLPACKDIDQGNLYAFWDDDEIQQWFLANVNGPPTYEGLRVRTKGLFGSKERILAGWVFENGGRLWITKTGHPKTISILSNGSRHCYDQLAENDPRNGFNAGALREMATLCNVALPPRPRPPAGR